MPLTKRVLAYLAANPGALFIDIKAACLDGATNTERSLRTTVYDLRRRNWIRREGHKPFRYFVSEVATETADSAPLP